MGIIDEIRTNPEEGALRLEREYKKRLMAVALDICNDPVEAEALVFDTFGDTVRYIESLENPEALFSWMCRILVSRHNKATRRKSSERVVYSATLPEPPPDDIGVNQIIQEVDGKLSKVAPLWNGTPLVFTNPFLRRAEPLVLAPHGERENAAELDAFRKDAAELVKDESDGLWPNAGGSAYFAWALISGVRRGWLDPAKYGPIARRAWLARVRAVVTFPNDTEAKAAALLAANALNRR